jgi:hypothetical protein
MNSRNSRPDSYPSLTYAKTLVVTGPPAHWT